MSLKIFQSANIIQSKLNNLKDKVNSNKAKQDIRQRESFYDKLTTERDKTYLSLSPLSEVKGLNLISRKCYLMLLGRRWTRKHFLRTRMPTAAYTHKHYITRNFIVHFPLKCYDIANNFLLWRMLFRVHTRVNITIFPDTNRENSEKSPGHPLCFVVCNCSFWPGYITFAHFLD